MCSSDLVAHAVVDRLFRLLSSTIDDCVRDAAVSALKRNRVQVRSYERV